MHPLLQVCNTVTESVCHTESDTVVETTTHEDCRDIVTQECTQVRQGEHLWM